MKTEPMQSRSVTGGCCFGAQMRLEVTHWWGRVDHVHGTPSQVQVNTFNIDNRTWVGVRDPRAWDDLTGFAAAAEAVAAPSWSARDNFTRLVAAAEAWAAAAARHCRACSPRVEAGPDETSTFASSLPDLNIFVQNKSEFIFIYYSAFEERHGNTRVVAFARALHWAFHRSAKPYV